MKRNEAVRFIDHLLRLKNQDRGALAALRHSLAFAPGDDPKAFPYIERFVGRDWHSADARRLAMYAVAGLFAVHPVAHERSLSEALGKSLREKGRPSLELRFRALLDADANGVMSHLRQSVSLLAADSVGYDQAGLLCDLAVWLNERIDPARRDEIKRRWARAFYGALQADEAADATTPPTTAP